MKELFKLKNHSQGAVALILVIMITTLTLVSALVVSWINTAENTASYHVTESESTASDIDSCISDALARISSSTSVSGSYNLFGIDISCAYEISIIEAGIITVTSTASSTSDLGYWQDQIIMQVNVSTTPISIDTYKTDLNAFASLQACGDGECGDSEDCTSCSTDCGACAVCGNGGDPEPGEVCDDGNTDDETQTCNNSIIENGTYCNSDCSAEIVLTETCDDGAEACGDGTVQSGTYCNATCDGTYAYSEGCDYTSLSPCGAPGSPSEAAVGCSKNPLCDLECTSCTSLCF